MLEEQLISKRGQLVTVVRPFFGSQSESFHSSLDVIEKSDGNLFHLSTDGPSIIFKFSDVKSIEKDNVIRLKGPMDYRAEYIS